MRQYQKNALIFVAGLLVGYVLTYYMLSKSISFKTEEAYELGYDFGVYSAYQKMIEESKRIHDLNLDNNPHFINIELDSLSIR